MSPFDPPCGPGRCALAAAGRWHNPKDVHGLLGGHQLRAADLANYTRPIKTST